MLKHAFRKCFSTHYDIIMPNIAKHRLDIKIDMTFADIEKELKAKMHLDKVEFKTWDNSSIAKNNKINCFQLQNDPIFLKLNNAEWQILNHQNFDFTTTEKHKYIKSDFSHDEKEDLDQIGKTVSLMNKNKNLKSDEIKNISMDLFRIKHFYNQRNITQNLGKFKNLQELFQSFYESKHLYANMHSLREKLLRKSENKAKFVILMGGLLFVVELFLIYYGTFIKFSWDIVEPMTYLMGCMNFVLILYFRKKFKTSSANEYFTNRFFNKMLRKHNMDKQFIETEKRLREIEAILNK